MPKHVTGTHDGSLETQRFDPRIRIRSDERAIAEQSKAAKRGRRLTDAEYAQRLADRARSKAITDRAATLARLDKSDTIDAYGNERRDSH